MQIQVGKKYRTRGGRVAEVVKAVPGCELAFVFRVDGLVTAQSCTVHGKYWPSGFESSLDLVEEIQEFFVIGKKYVQRNGDIVECTAVRNLSDYNFPVVIKNLTTGTAGHCRTAEGKYWDSTDSPFDIVKEYVEPVQPSNAYIQPHPCKELIEEYARQYASGEKAAGWWQWYVLGSIAPTTLTFVNGTPEDYHYEMTEKHPDFVPATLPVPVVARKHGIYANHLVVEFASEKEANQAVKYFDKLIADSKKQSEIDYNSLIETNKETKYAPRILRNPAQPCNS